MHAIDKNSLREFRDRLPRKPYHTDRLGDFLRIHRADIAARARYIQPNGPTHMHWLVFDIDRPGAAMDWEDRHVPPPNFSVQNPHNGHAHLFYGLATPVRTAPNGRIAPLRYATSVQNAVCEALAADRGYTGFLCKNPLNGHWRTTEWESRLYQLADFEGWLDLSAKSRQAANSEYGLGRNCTLFDRLRRWAYRAIRQGWPDADRWHIAVLERARGYNVFDAPLSDNEVKAIARSVAKYTYRNFNAAGFSAWQSAQGRKGGKASKRGPVSDSARTEKPWELLGISRATYYRRKAGQNCETR